jgi:hypothetical protein
MHFRVWINIKNVDKNLKAFIIIASLKSKCIRPTYLMNIMHTQCQYEEPNNANWSINSFYISQLLHCTFIIKIIYLQSHQLPLHKKAPFIKVNLNFIAF